MAEQKENTIKVVSEQRALKASKKIINAKTMTIIPNSQAEYCIYTYSTKVDTHFDIKDPDYFNPLYTFIKTGDTIRIFRYEKDILTTYYEYIVTNVDKVLKTVNAVCIFEKNLTKAGKN